jgi:hypothetical protein
MIRNDNTSSMHAIYLAVGAGFAIRDCRNSMLLGIVSSLITVCFLSAKPNTFCAALLS